MFQITTEFPVLTGVSNYPEFPLLTGAHEGVEDDVSFAQGAVAQAVVAEVAVNAWSLGLAVGGVVSGEGDIGVDVVEEAEHHSDHLRGQGWEPRPVAVHELSFRDGAICRKILLK